MHAIEGTGTSCWLGGQRMPVSADLGQVCFSRTQGPPIDLLGQPVPLIDESKAQSTADGSPMHQKFSTDDLECMQDYNAGPVEQGGLLLVGCENNAWYFDGMQIPVWIGTANTEPTG